MRIRSLDLLAFGPFREKTLHFGNDGGVEVVFGPNEAGKSTTRRAVLGLLFGIPERSKDGHSVDEVRVGAKLVDARGKTLDVVRRKGRKNTLLTPHGEPLDEQILAGLVGGIDADTFELTYGLDHTRLRLGGAALRVGNGELGESLFSAATGLTGLHAVLVDLRREADALFVPRGTQRPLNEAQRSYTEAKKRAAQLATPPDEWLKVERQIEEARAELEALRAQRAELAAQRASAQAIATAARALESNRARLAEIEPSLASARAELEMLLPQVELLSRTQAIADLQERLGSHRKAQLDRPRVLAELETLDERASKARRDAPKGGDIRAPHETRVRKLALEGERLRERAKQIESHEIDAKVGVERAEKNIASLGEGAKADDLRAALDLAQHEGNVEARLEAAREAEKRERESAQTRMGALGVACGSLEELLGMPAPSPDVVSAHAKTFAGITERRRTAADRKRRLEEERADVERTLSALRAAGDVPTEEALLRARCDRDARWEEVRAKGVTDQVAARFERASLAADELADRLRREAARVTRASESNAAVVAANRKLEIANEELSTLDAEAGAATDAWASLWEPSGVKPRTPDEMVAWLGRFESACAAAHRALDAERSVKVLDGAASGARAALVLALGEDHRTASLTRLVQVAKRVLAASDEATAARSVEQSALRAAERKREQASHDRAAFERDRIEWERHWSDIARALGLQPSASPEEAEAALGALVAQERFDDEAEKMRRRLAGIDRDAARFADDVRQVCDACALDLVSRPAEEACVELARRVARAAEQRARRETLEEQERRLAAQVQAVRAAALRDSLPSDAQPEGASSAEARAADLDARLAELDDRIQHTSRHLGSVETGAKQFALSPAIEHASEAQRQLARVRDFAERYARARLAAAAVARLIERYRRENQGPVLERASALFAALTLGAFEGLEVGFGESDEPVLVAVREQRRLETSALSDGTLDQLYLALRVASLERLTASRGPLPLLLDDVLVHFDDQRAAAALAILSDLAKHTQVILFTHHARIVEIARRAISDRDGARAAGIHDLATL